MQTRSIFTVLAAMAMAGEALASHKPHMQFHRELEARRLHKHVKWVTVWETKTVYADANGNVKTASPDTYFSNDKPEKVENAAPAVPSAEEAAPSVQAEAEPEAPAVAPTTLATLVKPAESPMETQAQAPPAPAAPPAEEPVKAEEKPATPQNPPAQAPAGEKRGFAYNDAKLVSNLAARAKCSWAYNWDSHHNGLQGSGIDYVPMLWGDGSVHTDRWAKNVEQMLNEGATHILSFNEPDHPDQAHMDPARAARAHVQYMNPYGSRARIGSPGVTSADENPVGWGAQWLDAFMKECKSVGCQVDFCVTHWYGPAADFDWMIIHLEKVHEVCEGRPVWLTEFAPFGSDQEIAQFISKSIDVFEREMPWLERYSYFMTSVGSLMSSDSSPSTYGATYFEHSPSA